MFLPYPRENRIDREFLQQLVMSLEETFRRVFFRDSDVIIDPKARLILVAPNGTKYRLKVDNDGTLSTEVV